MGNDRQPKSRLLAEAWPKLARQIRDALIAEGEPGLAEQVEQLRVVEMCGCGDSFCRSIRTEPRRDGGYGPGHRNVVLRPPWKGWLILDVVDESIHYVEVLHRPPLD